MGLSAFGGSSKGRGVFEDVILYWTATERSRELGGHVGDHGPLPSDEGARGRGAMGK